MKALLIAAAAVTLGSGAALAAPVKHTATRGHLTPHERVLIARDQARVNAIIRQARADGRVTAWERAKIRTAQARHKTLVWRLSRS